METYRDPRIPKEVSLFVGNWYNNLVREVVAVVRYQWIKSIRDGIRGYIFSGPPGTGKTYTAWKIADALGLLSYYDKRGESVVMYRDCADLAFWRYGETEKQIREVFRRGIETANKVKMRRRDFGILFIFDDAEALFLTRSYGTKLDTWYISQLNVFFHEVDTLDTSLAFVILITNRKDLLDEALLDRFVVVEFPEPPSEVLVEYAERRIRAYGITDPKIIKNVRELVKNGAKTFRDVNRIVTKKFIEYAIAQSEM